jgi:molecular chaperone DnaJ
MGEAIQGSDAGDLYVKIIVASHKSIFRKGSDLYSNLDIRLTDALLGARHDIETLDGAKSVEIPSGTKINSQVVLKGLGVPKKISKEAKAFIEELKKEGI